jgi:hypothetical protein
MKKNYLFLLYVISSLCQAHAGWTIDTSSQQSFTPLRVGNEWVYHDSSYSSNGAISITDVERSVKLEKYVMGPEKDFWLASITKKGVFTLFASHNVIDTIDTVYTDTLRMLPDSSFSAGMTALFPWLGYDTADSQVNCSFRNLNDTSVMDLQPKPLLYAFENIQIIALSSIGMVYSLSQAITPASYGRKTSILKRFNGNAINVERFTAVRKPLGRQVSLIGTKRIRRVCTLTGQLRMSRGESYYSIQGKALSRRLPIISGIIIAK